jgi:hypothetical protein
LEGASSGALTLRRRGINREDVIRLFEITLGALEGTGSYELANAGY